MIDLKYLFLKGYEKFVFLSFNLFGLGGLLFILRDEEEVCLICLLEMVEGESLINCKDGCNNRLY